MINESYQKKRVWAAIGMFFVMLEIITFIATGQISVLGLLLSALWIWVIYDAIKASGIERFWHKFFWLERQ